jgi:hypothetical protein
VAFRWVALIIASSLLLGCSQNDDFQRRFAGRWGPKPNIVAADAQATLTNQLAVLSYIEAGANIYPSTTGLDPNWYYVTEWGFNIGRADCTAYLDNLFVIARERAKYNALFLDLSGAATAIVTATAPHSAALSLIAPAFGLAGNVSNRVFDSYLFSDTAPGIIQSKVKDLQDKFSDTVKTNKAQVNTSAAAYAAIQNYYNICLPQSIEGVLLEHIATGTATATDPGTPPQKKKTIAGAAIVVGAGAPAPVPRTINPKMSLQ